MVSFKNGKKVPEPGRPVEKAKNVEQNINVNAQIDIAAIANAVANAIGPIQTKVVNVRGNSGAEMDDDFDNSKSLEALADSMLVQRGKNESNFDNLGGIKETKRDKDETDKTIDLLKGLDD